MEDVNYTYSNLSGQVSFVGELKFIDAFNVNLLLLSLHYNQHKRKSIHNLHFKRDYFNSKSLEKVCNLFDNDLDVSSPWY